MDYCWPMGYGLQFPANQLGGWLKLWGTRSYGLSGVWSKRSLTVLTSPYTLSRPLFHPVEISPSIMTLALWNFACILYSILWIYSRFFFWPNCFKGSEDFWATCHTCRHAISESEWPNTLIWVCKLHILGPTGGSSATVTKFGMWQWCDCTKDGSGRCIGWC